MATLQKFKLLATQCTVAGSPTRSPTASPVIHLRRRRTLRMLLARGGGSVVERSQRPARCDDTGGEEGGSPEKSVRQKLKDLFVSSPPPPTSENLREGFLPQRRGGVRRSLPRSHRQLTATFRQRLLRRAWRPVLDAIPE